MESIISSAFAHSNSFFPIKLKRRARKRLMAADWAIVTPSTSNIGTCSQGSSAKK